MKKTAVILAAIAAIALPAQAQVFKCQEGGKTVFSDRPCHANAAPLPVTPAVGHDPSTRYRMEAERDRVRAEAYQKELAEKRAEFARQRAEDSRRNAQVHADQRAQQARTEMEELRLRCGTSSRAEVRVGMTMQFVQDCTLARAPVRTNVTRTARGEDIQWVLPDGGLYRYIYYSDGVVTAIQE